MALLRAFMRDLRGATSIEYAMIGVVLSVMCVVGATKIGQNLNSQFLGPLAGNLN
jgi:Flp pilus assembly pilin Flp